MDPFTVALIVAPILFVSLIIVLTSFGLIIIFNLNSLKTFVTKTLRVGLISFISAAVDTIVFFFNIITFNNVTFIIFVVLFVVGITAFSFISIIALVFNNVIQLSILGINIGVDFRVNMKDPVIRPLPDVHNTIVGISTQAIDNIYDGFCEEGIANACGLGEYIRDFFNYLSITMTEMFNYVNTYIQATGLGIQEILCTYMILGEGLEQYGCLQDNEQIDRRRMIPQMFESYIMNNDPRRHDNSKVILKEILINTPRMGYYKIPVYFGMPIIDKALPVDVKLIIENTLERRSVFVNITEYNAEPQVYFSFKLLDSKGVYETLQIIEVFIVDAMDFIINLVFQIITFIINIIVTLGFMLAKYLLTVADVIGKAIFHLLTYMLFPLRSLLNPGLMLSNFNKTLTTRMVAYSDTAYSKAIDLFMDLDPIETFWYPRNGTLGAWSPPGSVETREVVVDILRWVDDLAKLAFDFIPIITTVIDFWSCSVLNIQYCAADLYICELAFNPGYDNPGLFNILFGYMGVLFEGIDYAVYQLCKDAFYNDARYCVCKACQVDFGLNISGFEWLQGAINWLINIGILGVPCDVISGTGCCLISDPNYRSYNHYCQLLQQSDYTSLFYMLGSVFFEGLTSSISLPSRCTVWGTFDEIYEKIKDFGFTNLLLSNNPSNDVRDTYPLEWFHITPKNTSMGRFPFTYLDRGRRDLDYYLYDEQTSLTDQEIHGVEYHNVFNYFTQPEFCGIDSIGYNGPWLGVNNPTPNQVFPPEACSFFAYSLSICYGRYRDDYNTKNYEDDMFGPFILQNVECPDGYKMVKYIEDKVSSDVFRRNFMCTIYESWIGEERRYWFMFNLYIERIFNVWVDWYEDDNGVFLGSPVLNWFPYEQILDILGNSTRVSEFCDMWNMNGCESIFGGAQQLQLNYDLFAVLDACDFKNRWRTHIFDSGTEYFNMYDFNHMSFRTGMLHGNSNKHFYKDFCDSFRNESKILDMFGNDGDATSGYLNKLRNETASLDSIVYEYISHISDEYYPFYDKESFPCKPTNNGENSDFYNYEHTMAQQFMVMDEIMFSRYMVGGILRGWWIADLVIYENLCSYITQLEINWDCDHTDFYDTESHDLFNWDKEPGNFFNGKSYSFLKLFFRDLKNNYALIGQPGEFLDLAKTIAAGTPTSDTLEEQAIASILRSIKAKINQVGFGSIVEIYTNNADKFSTLAECIGRGHNERICTFFINSIFSNTWLKKCVLNPYDNTVADCVYIWYEEFYNYGEGLKIKKRVHKYKYSRI